ncbi:hypothetical protein F5887DRAFT_235977 [Amanita rubescens]|nr:hypothetical protein F5887DRAFT_235977 [Amanita rubescens]
MHSIARIFPPEIVREIYGCIYAPMRLHKLSDFPWYLGQICASWRSIFHSMTSNFWNRLDVDLSVMDEDRYSKRVWRHHRDVMLLVLRYFLDRTRGRPFSFQFKTRQYYLPEQDEWIVGLFKLLVAESIRWQEVNIRVTPFLLPILYKAKHNMPLLSSAQLVNVSHCANPQYIHDLFEDVPNLTYLELAPFSDWRANWASLSVLKLTYGYRYNHRLSSVLGQAKRLEKLALYGRPEDMLYPIGTASLINFPNLKVLSIVGVALLPLLQTPSLEELYIRVLNVIGLNWSQNQVTSFLTRSSCQLKCLGVAECSADFLADVLRYTPDLPHLKLDNDKDMVKYFKQLALYHSSAPLACHLRSLMVIDRGFSFMEIMELSVLLASRTEMVEANSGVAPVEKLQKLMIMTSSQVVQYNKRSAVQTLRQQCAEYGVEFTVQHMRDVPGPYYDDSIPILDW